MPHDDTLVKARKCPEEAAWINLVSGETTERDAERLLSHAADCAACAQDLRFAIAAAGESDDDPPVTPLSDQHRQRLAAKMAKPRGSRIPWIPMSIAAAVVFAIAAAVVRYWMWRGPSDSLASLAAAYATQRPIEARIEGAAWGPVRLERGGRSLAESSPQLLETIARIRSRATSGSDREAWLEAECRAEVLLWNYDAALRACASAVGAGARTRSLLVDYANAYVERAEATGVGADYNSAVVLLDHTLAGGAADSAALFNRALIFEKTGNTEAALRDYRSALQAESDAGWIQEIRQRIDRLGRSAHPL